MPEIKFESEWLKIGVNVEPDMHIRFNDAGTQDEDGKYEFNVTVIDREGKPTVTKKFGINKTNLKEIIKLYGSNSDNWVGEVMKVEKIKVTNPSTGERVDSIALAAPEMSNDPLA